MSDGLPELRSGLLKDVLLSCIYPRRPLNLSTASIRPDSDYRGTEAFGTRITISGRDCPQITVSARLERIGRP